MKEIPKLLLIVVATHADTSAAVSNREAVSESLGQSGWNSARRGAHSESRARSTRLLSGATVGPGKGGQDPPCKADGHMQGMGVEDAGCSLGRET